MNLLQIHTETHGHSAQIGNLLAEKATFAFEGPCLVGVMQKSLPVVAHRLAFTIDDDRRVIVLWRGRPSLGYVNLLGVSNDHSAVVLEGRRPGP